MASVSSIHPEGGTKNLSPSPSLSLPDFATGQEVTGQLFLEFFRASLALLSREKAHLNKINVFPVPDADTGTNMYFALRGGVKEVDQFFASMEEKDQNESKISLGDVVEKFAFGVLMKAQGNSGTCLSHFFSEVSNKVKASLGNRESLTVNDFGNCLKEVGKTMYEAMKDAKKGTILSVLNEGTQDLGGEHKDLLALITMWEKATAEAVNRTPEDLIVNGVQILKKKGVVDSGAKGILVIIRGIQKALSNPAFTYGDYNRSCFRGVGIELTGGQTESMSGYEHTPEECANGGWCTESVFKMKDKEDKKKIEDLLEKFGDSIAVATAAGFAKIHLHTQDPQKVFTALQKKSCATKRLHKIKAEDMGLQNKNSVLQVPTFENATVQVIWTSLDDIVSYLKPVADPWMVPFRLVVDGEAYLDRVELASIDMANITRRRDFSKTSTGGPSPLAVKELLDRAFLNPKIKEVLMFLPPRYLSAGTVHAAEEAREHHPKKDQIFLHEHHYGMSISGYGTSVAFELAAKGMNAKEISDAVKKVLNKSCMTVTQESIEGLVKSGRVPLVGKNKIIAPIAIAMKLKAVGWLVWPEEETHKDKELIQRKKETGIPNLTAPIKQNVVLNYKAAFKKFIGLTIKKSKIPAGSKVDIIISTACNDWLAEPLREMLHKTYDVRFFDYVPIAPTIISSGWYGSIYMSVIHVENDDSYTLSNLAKKVSN